jgi:hypothetical protein
LPRAQGHASPLNSDPVPGRHIVEGAGFAGLELDSRAIVGCQDVFALGSECRLLPAGVAPRELARLLSSSRRLAVRIVIGHTYIEPTLGPLRIRLDPTRGHGEAD